MLSDKEIIRNSFSKCGAVFLLYVYDCDCKSQFMFEPFCAAHVRQNHFLIGFDSQRPKCSLCAIEIFQLFPSPVWTGGRDKFIESLGAQLNKQ